MHLSVGACSVCMGVVCVLARMSVHTCVRGEDSPGTPSGSPIQGEATGVDLDWLSEQFLDFSS